MRNLEKLQLGRADEAGTLGNQVALALSSTPRDSVLFQLNSDWVWEGWLQESLRNTSTEVKHQVSVGAGVHAISQCQTSLPDEEHQEKVTLQQFLDQWQLYVGMVTAFGRDSPLICLRLDPFRLNYPRLGIVWKS